jgi:hypothetical protein
MNDKDKQDAMQITKTYDITKWDEMRYIAKNRYFKNDQQIVDLSTADVKTQQFEGNGNTSDTVYYNDSVKSDNAHRLIKDALGGYPLDKYDFHKTP